MKRIAVFVSGGGTNLQALLDAKDRGEIPGGEFVLVLSSSERAYALTRAADHGVESMVLSRKRCAAECGGREQGEAEFDRRLLEALEKRRIDLIVLAGYLSILSEKVVRAYAGRIINVHPALIPSFCGPGCYGLKVHEAALARGVKITGATVHFVNEIADGGPIIFQRAVEVLPSDTPESLQRRVMEQAEWVLLPKAVALFCGDKLRLEGGKAVIEA